VHEASLTLPADLHSVSRARHFLRDVLSEWGVDGYEMAAPQVLTELAANAALHAHSEYTVHLRLQSDCLVVEVTDSSPALPRHRHYGTGATTGRGIALVEALTVAWGVEASPTGKTVWCRVGSDDSIPDFTDGDEPVADATSVLRRTPRAGSGPGTVLASAA
jgi:anti-sigma regulatory factor (Ser/Thr protein kinase)